MVKGIFLTTLWLGLFLCCVGYAWEPSTAKIEGFEKNAFWGSETNCLKAGLSMQSTHDKGHTLVGFFILLNNNCKTNIDLRSDMLWLWLPPFDRMFQMELIDANGQPVIKTTRGKALGKQLDRPLVLPAGFNSEAGYTKELLLPHNPSIILPPFILEDYFSITNAGTYKLKFVMKVIKISETLSITSLKKYPPPTIELPPVYADVPIKYP